MKYKVGDSVKVVNERAVCMNEIMCKFLGKEVTIVKEDYTTYSIEEDGRRWYWMDNMFTGLVPEKTCKNCKYKDFKDTSFPCCNCSENYFNQFEAKSTNKLEELKDKLITMKKCDNEYFSIELNMVEKIIKLIEEMESEDEN